MRTSAWAEMQWRCRHARCVLVAVCLVLGQRSVCHGQVSFQSAVTLALVNSPQLKSAQQDMDKARAGLSVMKDIFVPSVVTTGGAGDSYGITLTVPTIFTVNAQSLIFSFQQRAYIHAAHSDIQAAQLALAEARNQVQEDTVITYISLDEAQNSADALNEQYGFAQKLVAIVQDRLHAGLDSDLDLLKAEREATQIRLQELQMEDNIVSLRDHLADLTGLPRGELTTQPESVPAFPKVEKIEEDLKQNYSDSPGVLAAEANAKAKLDRAKGDAEYTWRPIVSFGAQYGRVSPINNVSDFYNLHGNYNTANVGFQVQLPILDKVRKAAAQQAIADALRAKQDAANLRGQEIEGRQKLARSIPELETKADLAELDYKIAQNQLQSTLIQLHAANSAPPMTPKEEQSAHIEERQKYLDYLDAQLQAAKSEVYFLRQAGQLGDWAQSPVSLPSESGEKDGTPASH
jgi:outer membrane protein TolC